MDKYFTVKKLLSKVNDENAILLSRNKELEQSINDREIINRS
tara:strand:+ start:747 stop:872 length:126 start_codon:yes stop_codon:yes gene_type:complete